MHDCSDKQVIADNFNNFFASIGKLNASNIGGHHDSSYFLNIKFDLLETLFAFHCNHYFHKYIIFLTVELIQNTPPTLILPHPLSFPH